MYTCYSGMYDRGIVIITQERCQLGCVCPEVRSVGTLLLFDMVQHPPPPTHTHTHSCIQYTLHSLQLIASLAFCEVSRK